jgi:hypothetical protein
MNTRTNHGTEIPLLPTETTYYPIYRVTFSGSNDYMAASRFYFAANSPGEALTKARVRASYRSWQQGPPSGEVLLVPDLFTTNPDYAKFQ